MLLGMVLRELAKSGSPRKRTPKKRTIYRASLLGGWQCKHRHSSKASASRCGQKELRRRRKNRGR